MNARLVSLLRATPRHRAGVGSVVLLLVLSMPLGGARPTSPAEAQVHRMHQSTVAAAASNPAADECGQQADGVVVIQGIFDPPGETLLRLNPVRRYSYRAALSPRQREGRFAVVVSYATGQVT